MTITSDTDKRTEFTAGLRALADVLDEHPEIDLPYYGTGIALSFGFHGYDIEDHAGALASAARVLMPGTREKHVDGDYYRVEGHLHGLKVECWAMRDQVCTRVVHGTREIVREAPDPEALAAVPTTTVTETVEDVEWVCAPLLADRAEPVPA